MKSSILKLKSIDFILQKRHLTLPQDRILFTCSGGQDSGVCLLLLMILRTNWDWSLGTIYCNHRWQFHTMQSMTHMNRWTYSLNLPFYSSLLINSPRSENLARIGRDRTFQRIAWFHQYNKLATGHTAQDRLESYFLQTPFSQMRTTRWMRGSPMQLKSSSLQKLTNKNVCIIRPYLGLSRYDLAVLNHKLQVPIYPDTSNLSSRFRRNRFRYELLPYLRAYWDSSIDYFLVQYLESTNQQQIQHQVNLPQVSSRWLSTKQLAQFPQDMQTKIIINFLKNSVRSASFKIKISTGQLAWISKGAYKTSQWIWFSNRCGLLITPQYFEIMWT